MRVQMKLLEAQRVCVLSLTASIFAQLRQRLRACMRVLLNAKIIIQCPNEEKMNQT